MPSEQFIIFSNLLSILSLCMIASCESDEGDGECRSPQFNILDEISSAEDDSDQSKKQKSGHREVLKSR